MRKPLIAAALAAAVLAVQTAAQAARDYISIVGSSTVYPFATVVAEQFGKTTRFKTPKIESTGSGGGLKLFCEGVGIEHPDITNASRRINKSEVIFLVKGKDVRHVSPDALDEDVLEKA